MPYKSDVVLQKIREIQQRRREITSSSASFSLLERTSRDFKEIVSCDEYLLATMKENLMSSDFKLTLKRHIKESFATIYSRELVKFDLKQTHAYQKIKNARNLLFDIVVTKSSVIITEMMRFKRRKRDDDNLVKTKHAMKTTQVKLKMKQIKRQREFIKL